MKRLTLLVGLVLAFAGALAGQAGAVDAAPTATERLHTLDQAILGRLNATRAAHGLRPLRLSQELQNAAVFHSRSMLEGGFFAHESRDGTPFVVRVKRFYSPAGWRSWSAGENLLFNSAAISADEAIEAWLGSPPHRRLMLDPSWREVGIGSLRAASAGGMFGGEQAWVITMDFGTREGAVKTKRTAAVQAKAAPKPRPEKPAAQKNALAKKPTGAKTGQAKPTRPPAERAAAATTWTRPDVVDDTDAADEAAAGDDAPADDEAAAAEEPAGEDEDVDEGSSGEDDDAGEGGDDVGAER